MKEFKYIEWHNSYSSGVCEIDRQHKKLINILNDSIKHADGNQTEEEKFFNKKIIKAMELLEKHYKTEEAILSGTKYENMNKHKEEHAKFLEMMKKRTEEIKSKEIKLDLFPSGFNTPPLWGVNTGGVGDLFPHKRNAFKVKSSIPRGSAAGIFYLNSRQK